MTSHEEFAVLKFDAQSHHGWTYQPIAKVVNAGISTNPVATYVEITVTEGHALSEKLQDYTPVSIQVFTMAGVRIALGS